MNLLDIIFPKRCVACGRFGSYLCEEDKKKIQPAKSFCPVCLSAAIGGTVHTKCRTKLSLDGLVCIFEYITPIKEVIAELKYRFVRDLEGIVGEELRRVKLFDRYDFASFSLVPIPLSAGRKNWRGFNQTEVLGRLIAQRLKTPFDSQVLTKLKETKPQVRLPRKERIRQIAGAFGVVSHEKIGGKNFLIFDDVWTTGATMKAAASTLKRKGAKKVWGIAFASSH
ncbi:MAG TPA: ComF family protein [Candidatus Nanoarchaeia archaeon]